MAIIYAGLNLAKILFFWSLEMGPSAVVLPKLLKKVRPVDVFLHGSASNYDNQMTEFKIIFENMSLGGILISDMLNNDAFMELVESVNCRWSVIRQTKDYPIGVFFKLPKSTQ